MEEMVEPDRTIMIVSIIGLVIIWGSVLYHKFAQDGSSAQEEPGAAPTAPQVQGEGAAATQRKKKR